MYRIYWPYVLGFIVGGGVAVIGALLLTFGFRMAGTETGSGQREARRFRRNGWGALVIGVAIALYTALPLNMEYHHYELISGTVSGDVGSRLLTTGTGTDKNVSEVYAVPIGAGVFRCDDTRCSVLRKGDKVGLWCVRLWQWTGTPGWDCRFDNATPAANSKG